MKSCLYILFFAVAVPFAAPVSADVFNMPSGQTSLEFVAVGNLGNAGELSGSGAGGFGPNRVCGAVNYTFNMGKYEVTAGQYCEFLNAVAKTDNYGLYNTDMDRAVYTYGCNITRTGSSGSYTYSVATDWANRPVNLVSWGDAARFCNWLANGQKTGMQDLTTTEDGSYYLNGAINQADLMAVVRTANAKYFIPTEDEWYKAAYHKNDGVTGNYWGYPTSSDSVPSNDLVTPDAGNNADFRIGDSPMDLTIGYPYYRTEVGEFENSASPYGTFDQGGNVWEWNETVIGINRGERGGGWNGYDNFLLASYRSYTNPTHEGQELGFRVAEVPEPATLLLLASGLLLWARKRRKQNGQAP